MCTRIKGLEGSAGMCVTCMAPPHAVSLPFRAIELEMEDARYGSEGRQEENGQTDHVLWHTSLGRCPCSLITPFPASVDRRRDGVDGMCSVKVFLTVLTTHTFVDYLEQT